MRTRPQPALPRRIQLWSGRVLSRRRTLTIAGAVFLLYVYVAGDYGLVHLYEKWRSVDFLAQEHVRLEAERQELLARRARLESGDLRVIERIARERYGMVRPGETLYRIRRTPDDSGPR